MQVGLNSSKTVAMQQSSTKDVSKEEQTARDAKSIVDLASSKLDKDSIKELSNIGGKAITQAYIMQFQQQSLMTSMGNFNSQGSILDVLNSGSSQAISMLSQIDFASIGYDGKNPLAMNSDELNFLISEEGFFGVENTANRIADFVINGAGDDLEKLQKGFEGMKRGFEEAERMWGGSLPQISQESIDKAIEKVSARIEELGGKAVNINA
ncbi:hypothetical protein [Campylobacter avium]|uniref:hypothetical protein n=1 Tax=Campylobacter avium TaxID=522485 RepID=UPI00235254AE|nr:hypothetical protein [Campylobacter avium]